MLRCELQARSSATDDRILALSGALTVEHAEEARQALLAALEQAKLLTLDCTGVTAIDLSGLQLLCSAHRTASLGQRQLHLASPLPQPLRQACCAAGFTRLQQCRSVPAGSRCLWQDSGT